MQNKISNRDGKVLNMHLKKIVVIFVLLFELVSFRLAYELRDRSLTNLSDAQLHVFI